MVLVNQNFAFFRDAVQYITFTCEPGKMLPFLEEEIIKNGGNIQQKVINNIQELADFDVTINCTGVNARILAEDENVHPIRGQVTRVSTPSRRERNYF